MVLIIKRGDSTEKVNKLLAKLQEEAGKKGVDTTKHCGTIKLKEDPLEIQRKLRDEWQ